MLLLINPALLHATAYTVTSTPRITHVGDQPPPCDTLVKIGTTVSNAGSTIWATPPTCTIPTASLGTPGSYPITVTPGTLLNGGDSAVYTNGVITVIPPDGIGAKLVNALLPTMEIYIPHQDSSVLSNGLLLKPPAILFATSLLHLITQLAFSN